MLWIITLLASLTVLLLVYGFLQWLFLTDRRMNKRMSRYLALSDKKQLDRKRFNLIVQFRLYKTAVREKVLTKEKNRTIEQSLEAAGIAIRAEEYMLFRWIAAGLAAGIGYLIASSIVFLLIAALVGYLMPAWYVKHKHKKRIEQFNDELPDMITTLIGSLRAGFSFAQSLKVVVEESQDPMKREMETVLREMQYGTSVEEALHNLQLRVPSEDLDLMVQTILIQKQVGGNLATVLETIVNTIRERNRIQRQVVTLTAQGRLSGIVVGCLPIAVGAIIYMMQPDYMGSFFKHPLGIGMIAGGTISGIIGFILIRRITTIEV